MSTAVPIAARPEAVSQNASSAAPSVEELVQSLSAEVAAAQERVRSLQTEAASDFDGQEHRLMRFVTVADRIHAILLPRLQAFRNVNVFKDITHSVSRELTGPETQGFHGRTTTLTVPRSDSHSTPTAFSFRQAFAVATKDYQGQTYHFDTNESLQTFEEDPSKYVATTDPFLTQQTRSRRHAFDASPAAAEDNKRRDETGA